MIRKIAMLAAVATLVAAPAAQAQQKDALKVGIGASLETFNSAQFSAVTVGAIPGTPVSVYVPIQINQHLRIEPSLGFATFSQDRAAAAASPVTNLVSAHAWNLGVGVLYYPAPAQPAGFYVGGRLGLVFSGFSTVNGANTVLDEFSETDFYLRAVLGGEYFVAPRFSVGVEAQLGPTFFGDQKETVTPPPSPATVSRSGTGWSTSGLIFARFFF